MGTVTLQVSIIILILIVFICAVLCVKRLYSAKLLMSICLFILVACTIGVIFIPKEESILIGLSVNLLASTIFAVIYTSISDNNHATLLKKIENKLDNRITLDYFKADYLYASNDIDKPNIELCKELTKMLSDSTMYIYEGENATTASICMLMLSRSYKNERKHINAHFIIRNISTIKIEQICINDDLKKDVREIFTTLFLLHNIARDNQNINITIYRRDSTASQYINLTDKGVFFSPYKKTPNGYPKTCLFKKHKDNDNTEDLYQLFNQAWNARIQQNELCPYNIKNGDILNKMKFKKFAKAGFFSDEISRIVDRGFTIETQQIRDYFTSLVEERKNIYHIK